MRGKDVTPYLFIYGTLLPQARGRLGITERARLAREASGSLDASLCGDLFHLGAYPGLVLARSGGPPLHGPPLYGPRVHGPRVHGKIVERTEPARTFRWLDAYEGIGVAGMSNDYDRTLTDVMIEGGGFAGGSEAEHGKVVRAWVYALKRRSPGLCRIPGGRWALLRSAN